MLFPQGTRRPFSKRAQRSVSDHGQNVQSMGDDVGVAHKRLDKPMVLYDVNVQRHATGS